MKKVISLFVMLVLALVLAACDSGAAPTPTQPVISAPTVAPTVEVPTSAPTVAPTTEPTKGDADVTATVGGGVLSTPGTPGTSGEARMIIETPKGRIVLKLFTDPSANVTKTILNFAQKANSGYFNGLTFHRVESWVVQGGDPQGTGMGGGDMPSEYNQLPFTAGALGVARGGDPAINNDSQFFIVKDGAAAASLVGQYTNWGQVTEGMDVVTQLAVGDKMTSVTIEGVDVTALSIAATAEAAMTPTAVPTVAAQATAAPVGTVAPGKMTIETDKGTIVLELYTDPAANVSKTIANFVKKANNGYFDGLTFHRVEDWVIQGGDPLGNGMGGATMPSEYNDLPFTAGSLGVARGGDPAINNDSQFFIVKIDSPHLNSQYTNWGKVTEGMDVVNKIAIGDKIIKIRIEGVQAVQESDHITVQHILIGFKDAVGFQGNAPEKAQARTQEQAKALADDLMSQIKAGADFDALVTQYTDDSPPGIYNLANNGVPTVTPDDGSTEYSRGGMVPAFGNVGFALQVGEVGLSEYDQANSPYGYHIIKRIK